MRLVTTDNQLVIHLTKRESVNAWRRKLIVPKDCIQSVEWQKSFHDWPKYPLRLPGSYLPGVIMAGSYYSSIGWDFVYVHKPSGWTKPTLRNVLVITTSKRYYRRIILSQPEALAKELETWLKQK